jgi:enoyl-CoA hydratase
VAAQLERDGDVCVERRPGGVLLVTLNRPASLNAMTHAMHAELIALWDEIRADRGTGAVVITGAGRAFCAGNDLRQPRPAATDLAGVSRSIRELVYGAIELDQPVVAAINGHAVGIGLALALAADVTVAAEDARLLDGQTGVGVTSGEISTLLWPLLTSMAKAKYHLLANVPLSGAEAERIGLVSRARAADEVLPEALRIAGDLARGSREAIAWTKRTLGAWPRRAAPAFELSTTLEMLGLNGPDALEAAQAFRDKRPPAFPSAQIT